MKIKNKRKDARLAYDSKKIGKEFIFEDNLYQNIGKEHLRAFLIMDYFNMLNISEELENDIIQINKAIQHLKIHEKYMNYEKVIQDIKQKNVEVRKEIKELDTNFCKIYNDLKEINGNYFESNNAEFKNFHSMKSMIENEDIFGKNIFNENE